MDPVTHRRIRRRWDILLAWITAAAAGCGGPILSMNDVIRMEGTASLLAAYAERKTLTGSWSPIEGVEVTFWAKQKQAARAVTDKDGYAAAQVQLAPDVKSVKAKATIDGADLSHEGVVHTWPADRTIIVCDIDGTISWTDYEQLFLHESNKGSTPVEDAHQTLHKLSEHFNIGYLSARPRSLLRLTKQWLQEHDFPYGPVIMASSIDQGIHAERFKTKSIREHRKRVPQILIGIGNLDSDAEAYGANGMLALIRHKADDRAFRAHAIVLPDWAAIREFFDANRKALEDPDKLAKALQEGRMFLQPRFPYQPQK